MEARMQKWGNSLALRIPKTFASEIGLEEATTVQIERVGHQLIITPLAPPTTPRLSAMLAQITPDNIHAEIESGASQGQEIW